jgi:hypothetical protein
MELGDVDTAPELWLRSKLSVFNICKNVEMVPLNPFRMRTYLKQGRGVPSPLKRI